MSEGPSERDPLIGTEVAGRYRVVRRIGRGGMGSIYEVHHMRVDRSFAMKTLAWDVAQETESVARFRREADVIAKLRHPNIVEIVDWDTLGDGTPCLIMEYLRGEDLSRRIRTAGPLPWNVIAQFADQVLSALVVAHQAGIVHRDLKPQNIFLSVDDSGEERAKLLDFGVSKISGLQSLTTESRLIGTPSYMSPEQAEGQQDEVGEPTDVWAMGAILYEMATGSAAFEGANLPSILYKICHGAPEPLAARRVDAPPAFVEIVERALDRDPAKRLTRIHSLRAGLRRALTGLPNVVYAEPLRAQTPATGVPIGLALSPTVASGETPAPMIPETLQTTLSTTAAESMGAKAVASPIVAARPMRKVWIAVAAVVGAAAAVVVIVMTRGDNTSVAVENPAVASGSQRVAVEPPPPPPPADAAVVAAPVKHTIRSVPPGAKVFERGVLVGETPFVSKELPRGSAEIVYVVEKPGYVREEVRLATSEDAAIDVRFKLAKLDPKPPKPPEIPKPGSGTPPKPPDTPKPPVPCRKKGELPDPFNKKPPCPD